MKKIISLFTIIAVLFGICGVTTASAALPAYQVSFGYMNGTLPEKIMKFTSYTDFKKFVNENNNLVLSAFDKNDYICSEYFFEDYCVYLCTLSTDDSSESTFDFSNFCVSENTFDIEIARTSVGNTDDCVTQIFFLGVVDSYSDYELNLSVTDNIYISTAQELKSVADNVKKGNTYEGKNIVLRQDIDLSSVCGASIGDLAVEISWDSIGDKERSFNGTFDGNNHTISGLYINSSNSDCIGLFGHMGEKAVIKNLTVDGYIGADADRNESYYVGAIAGRNEGVIENCYNKADISVSGSMIVGGIVGDNNGTIRKCSNSGVISTDKYLAGGICGRNFGEIENSFNMGNVSGDMIIGGICAQVFYGNIHNCYNIGMIKGNEGVVGGILGDGVASTIEKCYYLNGCNAEGTVFDSDIGTVKTAEQFASGEVAYLLNSSTNAGSLSWYQNIGSDKFPVLDNTHSVVFFDGEKYYNDTPVQGDKIKSYVSYWMGNNNFKAPLIFMSYEELEAYAKENNFYQNKKFLELYPTSFFKNKFLYMRYIDGGSGSNQYTANTSENENSINIEIIKTDEGMTENYAEYCLYAEIDKSLKDKVINVICKNIISEDDIHYYSGRIQTQKDFLPEDNVKLDYAIINSWEELKELWKGEESAASFCDERLFNKRSILAISWQEGQSARTHKVSYVVLSDIQTDVSFAEHTPENELSPDVLTDYSAFIIIPKTYANTDVKITFDEKPVHSGKIKAYIDSYLLKDGNYKSPIIFMSYEELESYVKGNEALQNKNLLETYPPSFFENKFLYVRYIDGGSGSNQYTASSSENENSIDIKIIKTNGGMTDDYIEYYLYTEIDKSLKDKEINVICNNMISEDEIFYYSGKIQTQKNFLPEDNLKLDYAIVNSLEDLKKLWKGEESATDFCSDGLFNSHSILAVSWQESQQARVHRISDVVLSDIQTDVSLVRCTPEINQDVFMYYSALIVIPKTYSNTNVKITLDDTPVQDDKIKSYVGSYLLGGNNYKAPLVFMSYEELETYAKENNFYQNKRLLKIYPPSFFENKFLYARYIDVGGKYSKYMANTSENDNSIDIEIIQTNKDMTEACNEYCLYAEIDKSLKDKEINVICKNIISENDIHYYSGRVQTKKDFLPEDNVKLDYAIINSLEELKELWKGEESAANFCDERLFNNRSILAISWQEGQQARTHKVSDVNLSDIQTDVSFAEHTPENELSPDVLTDYSAFIIIPKTYSNTDVKITLDENNKTYPYTITDLRIKNTAGEEIIKPSENQSFIVEADIVKTEERSENDYFFVAVYDEKGALMNIDYVKAKFAVDRECSFGFNIPAQKNAVGSVKAFVWNTFNSMESLAEGKIWAPFVFE